MSLERNKAVVKRYIELWQTGDVEIADEIIGPGYVDHSHPEWPDGVEGLKASVRAFHQAFSDVEGSIGQMLGEGDLVAFRFALQARHTGPAGPFPPTGKQVSYRGIDLWPTAHRFRRGNRLRLQVSSCAHPRYARNTGSGEPLASATKLIAADQSIYHDPNHPSAMVLSVSQ